MTMTVYMPALGMMGAALAGRLTGNGVRVIADLDQRSPATRRRAEAAGVEHVSPQAMAESDFVLSVAPPDQAMAIAEQFAALAAASGRSPVYADMNAVSPQTALRIGDVIARAGARFVDGGIIGLPPDGVRRDPVLYVSGPAAAAMADLNRHGLRVSVLDAPLGAASALKLSYAGITKGLIALGAAMMLAASRAGVAPALAEELAASQPQLLASFRRSIPDMMPKAARWVSEMHEISAFADGGASEAEVYAAFANFYDCIGRDYASDGERVASLRDFLALAGDGASQGS